MADRKPEFNEQLFSVEPGAQRLNGVRNESHIFTDPSKRMAPDSTKRLFPGSPLSSTYKHLIAGNYGLDNTSSLEQTVKPYSKYNLINPEQSKWIFSLII